MITVAQMTAAQEAAERIIEQRGNPVNFQLFVEDAAQVASALLATNNPTKAKLESQLSLDL